MNVAELFILSIALSMDAFAVAICKGLAMPKMSWRKSAKIGIYFGVFQAIMPCIGYCLGIGLEDKIKAVDHWVALLLLSFIGIKMIREAIQEKEDHNDDWVDSKTMFALAIATSIDALAIGVTFAFLKVNLLKAMICIGMITFLVSIWGVKIGNLFGDKYKKKAEVMGGITLLLIGIKLVLEHLGIIVF